MYLITAITVLIYELIRLSVGGMTWYKNYFMFVMTSYTNR